MSTSKIIKTKGIILGETNFSEADKMLTILTPNLGKISCVAKGARRTQSRFLAASQLFAFSDMILYKGNGDTYHVNSAEIIESFYSLRNSYDKLACAMECTKFIKDIAYENQDTAELMQLFLNTIYLISLGEKNFEQIEVTLKLKALMLLGYMPNVFYCGNCGKKEGLNYFDIKSSAVRCDNCKKSNDFEISDGTVAAIRYILRSHVKKVYSFVVSDEVLQELKMFTDIYCQSVEV